MNYRRLNTIITIGFVAVFILFAVYPPAVFALFGVLVAAGALAGKVER